MNIAFLGDIINGKVIFLDMELWEARKTANALMVEYNYRERGKKAVLAKPKTDTRDGRNIISSRIGLSSPCILVEELEQMPDEKNKGI